MKLYNTPSHKVEEFEPVNPDEVEKAVRRAMEQLESRKQLKEVASKTEESEENGDILMHKVKHYLQYNYMLYDISLDSISSIVSMAPAYFSSWFKKCFGINFVDYVTELRMNAAREYLQDPLRSASEIAGMVGYDNASYFARAFKKHTGMTPTEYRRQQGWKKVQQ
jgi:YesN/AraC family two-component response regulator